MRCVRWFVLVVMFGGCLQGGEVVCADGRVCPAGYTCASIACFSPSQLSACDGVAEGEPCTVPQLGGGRCAEGGCVVPYCGNGVIEPGEACDDGNQLGNDGCNGTCTSDESCGNAIIELTEECDGGETCNELCRIRRCGDSRMDPGELCDDGNRIAGDGCNFDCTSTEVCGNNVLDYFRGERCDDGNMRSRDGCSGACQEEARRWRLVGDPAVLPGRENGAIAFDSARGKIVVFGGNDGQSTATANLYEGANQGWTRITPATSAVPRVAPAFAYDSKRGRIVMFGGYRGAMLSDTVEYDGTRWVAKTPATSPPARGWPAAAYDSARDRVVMFGGAQTEAIFGNGINYADTWEYDGTTWIQQFPATPPTPRRDAATAYDPVRGVIVMFGGLDAGATNSETWEYNGTNWNKITPATTTPPARFGARMAYDPVRKVMVMFGGRPGPVQFALDDTYEWSGTDWALKSPTSPPAARAGHMMVYDQAVGAIKLMGGSGNTNWISDCYQYTTPNWNVCGSPGFPSTRSLPGFAHDLRRGITVLFGGYSTDNATYELRGDTWIRRVTQNKPLGRSDPAMAYDSKRGVMVLFGGSIPGTGSVAETWEYNGTDWSPKSPAASPSPRHGHNMVYDSARDRIVLFGGYDPSNPAADTWEYNGTTWSPITTAHSPPARGWYAMSYDPIRQRVYVFGGGG
jgi:cysteine-rich repeat protein